MGYICQATKILDSSDVYLANRRVGSESPLAPGDSYTASRTVNIPAGSHIGKPYILVKTDYSGNYEIESNESNNVRAFDFINTDPNTDLGDLVVSDLTLPVEPIAPDEAFEISWTVTNQGNNPITGNWYDYLYVSGDENLDNAGLSGHPRTANQLHNLSCRRELYGYQDGDNPGLYSR